MYEVTNDWIEEANEEFRRDNVPHIRRPWLAWMKWSKHIGLSTELGDKNVKRIFSWFTENSPAGAHQVGSFYTGLFYYDAHFWPVSIPIIAGTVELKAFDSLETTPKHIKYRIMFDANQVQDFLALYGDCVDYSFGIEDLIKLDNSTLWQQLLRSADQQLKATVELFEGHKPKQKGVETARMATEMFLKSFISYKTGMTDDEIRKQLSHNLEKAVDKCLEIDPRSELTAIRPALDLFPKIDDRYKATDKTLWELWRIYGMAQYSGAAVVRALSGPDPCNWRV